ncbi:hypothetical protein IX83_00205 [Basilea psittacipulmonis DSM 24701]|uniref:CMP-Neu5Ac--lipooligosaccharide alpha 2-3 sialyltransferase n=1 Tax=Basilea psittacipulmonis DSM 24701 TaxID=1072685 RepID=A0A077DCP7_9BURK|nr:hypothetical protein IX83_00205 [Basilea psittacipulmonis DSM 24701]
MHRTSDNVIICGNGPSLKAIDYDRLPADYDVFRCNQFYFEDSYFIGKKIKAAFFIPSVLMHQYITMQKLIENGEYEIENIIVSRFNNPFVENEQQEKEIAYLVDVIDGYEAFLSHYLDVDALLRRYELFENKRITSGIYMIIAAMACGYKNIYIAGIDFYQDGLYAFDTAKTNILNLCPNIDKKEGKGQVHSLNFDINMIQYLRAHYDINLFSLCPDSCLSRHIPLSFNKNHMGGGVCKFNIEAKTGEWTKDIITVPRHIRWKIKQLFDSDLKNSKNNIYNNFYYKIIMDLVRFPKLFKKHKNRKK